MAFPLCLAINAAQAYAGAGMGIPMPGNGFNRSCFPPVAPFSSFFFTWAVSPEKSILVLSDFVDLFYHG